MEGLELIKRKAVQIISEEDLDKMQQVMYQALMKWSYLD